MIIKGKKVNLLLKILLIIGVVIVVLVIGLGGYMFVRGIGQLKNNSLSTKLEAYNIKNDFWDFGDKFDKEFNNILFCGLDNFNNTDVIMVISINKRKHNINVLRIPRDSYIGDQYLTGKINSVYLQPKEKLTGADTLAYEINNIFRIKIDKYVFMTLDVFREMIDDMGGVDIVLKNDLRIDNKKMIKAGNVHLNGELGENFVRHRKTYLTGDIGRIHAQEQFVKSLGKKLIEKKYLTNIPFLNKFYNMVETNIGRKEVGQYTEALKDIDVEQINTFVLEGEAVDHKGYSVYVLDIKKTVKLLNQYFMPEGLTLKESDLKLVDKLERDKVKKVETDFDDGLYYENNRRTGQTTVSNGIEIDNYLPDIYDNGYQDEGSTYKNEMQEIYEDEYGEYYEEKGDKYESQEVEKEENIEEAEEYGY